MVDPAVDVPEVRILLLGDSGVGKSTFVSYVFLFLGERPTVLAFSVADAK